MKDLQKTLKNLKPRQCLEIAKIVEPSIDWVLYSSINTWKGYDLVDRDSRTLKEYHFIFQIDYRDNVETNSRFRIYENLCEYSLSSSKIDEILNYLNNEKTK